MNKIIKPFLIFTFLLVIFAGVWIFLSQNNKSNIIISENICGGWDTFGETICSCQGKYTKDQCPSNAVCDGGNYYCSGQCGNCKCYAGSEKEGKEVPCNNPSLE